MRAIITVIGEDRVGIIAAISTVLAETGVNILDLSQTVMQGYFTMIMLVELEGAKVSFVELSDQLAQKGKEIELNIRIQREDIFKSMHTI